MYIYIYVFIYPVIKATHGIHTNPNKVADDPG